MAVDPAADAQAYWPSWKKHGAKLAAILLTHGHFDHVGAVRALKQATGAPVHLARADAGASRMLPLAPQDVDVFVQDGMALSFGGPFAARACHARPHAGQRVLFVRRHAVFRRHAV